MKGFFLAASLFFVGGIYAQEQTQKAPLTPEQKAQHKTERMSANLNLTDEQKTRLTEVHVKEAKQRDEIKNKALTEEQRQQEMQTLREASDAKYKEILTAEQYQQYKTVPVRTRGDRQHMNVEKIQTLEKAPVQLEEKK